MLFQIKDSIEEQDIRLPELDKPRKTKRIVPKKNPRRVPRNIRRFPRPINRYARPEGALPPPQYRTIVRKDFDKEAMDKWLSTSDGYIEGLMEDMEDKPINLYDYQREQVAVSTISRFLAVLKARQTGFSFIESLAAVANCQMKKLYTVIFISTGQEEANEKIRYGKAAYETIPEEYKKSLIVDNKQSLEFSHGRSKTRILSLPARQPRGKGTNTRVVLDEFAHIMFAREIYTAALPVISRNGSICLGSTPLGKGSVHNIIFGDKRKYKHYSRLIVSWWDCPDLCKNVLEARQLAPEMSTEERVKKYGTDILNEIFGSFEFDDFRQEYELYTADETVSYYPLDLINSCIFESERDSFLEDNIDPEEIKPAWEPIQESESDVHIPETIMRKYETNNFNWFCTSKKIQSDYTGDPVEFALEMVDELLVNMRVGDFGRTILGGMDIGRERDSSEICLVEEIEVGRYNLQIERFLLELVNIPFRTQKEIVRQILRRLKSIEKYNIDGTKGSHGADLAETLANEFPGVVEAIEFTSESKYRMAKNYRFRLEDRTYAIYNNSNAIKQIHSIKKKVTEHGNISYGAEKSKKHHGDKFWAKALASIAGREYDRDVLANESLIKYGNNRSFSGLSNNKENSIIRVSNNSIIPKMISSGGSIAKINNESYIDSMITDFADTTFYPII